MRAARVLETALAGWAVLAAETGCRPRGEASAERMKARLEELQRERDDLRARMNGLVTQDRRLVGMPETGVRLGVPTPLVRILVQRVLGGFVDSVTLILTDLKVHKTGKVKKLVTIGEYDLNVVIDEVTGKLEPGDAKIGFGGNQINVTLPVRVASGTGDATIDFKWDGKNVSGAVCGDMQIQQKVSGRVRPAAYSVAGGLSLAATTRQILASPKFPKVKVNLKVEPSRDSWDAVQKMLDAKGGVCGFVLDKVDIAGVLEDLVGKGFDVRLPTEKIKPMAVPVGIAPTITVRGEPLRIEVKVGHLAITEHMIWLGADVAVADASPALRGNARTEDGARAR